MKIWKTETPGLHSKTSTWQDLLGSVSPQNAVVGPGHGMRKARYSSHSCKGKSTYICIHQERERRGDRPTGCSPLRGENPIEHTLLTPGLHKSLPPLPKTPKHPPKIPNDPPLLVWECIGVHSTMERSAGQVLGGGMGGFGGGGPVAIYETGGFLNPGFRNL